MFLFSFRKNPFIPDLLAYIDKNGLEDRVALVTDDTMPDALLHRGHLDYIVKKAMDLGYPREKAIYVCDLYAGMQNEAV